MTRVQDADNTKYWRGGGATRILFSAGGNAEWYSILKTVWHLLTNLNILLPYNPATTLLGSYPGAEKICSHKNRHMDNYSSFIHNCQKFESNQDVLQ